MHSYHLLATNVATYDVALFSCVHTQEAKLVTLS